MTYDTQFPNQQLIIPMFTILTSFSEYLIKIYAQYYQTHYQPQISPIKLIIFPTLLLHPQGLQNPHHTHAL